jgi:hypothetical protein
MGDFTGLDFNNDKEMEPAVVENRVGTIPISE